MKRAGCIVGTLIFSVLLLSILTGNNSDCFTSDTTVHVYGTVTDESGEAVPGAVDQAASEQIVQKI